MTIGPRPEEGEERGKTDVNTLGQQQDWCVQRTFLGFSIIFIHLKKDLSLYITYPLERTFQTY